MRCFTVPLKFGTAIRLTVEPKDLTPVVPVLSLLRPLAVQGSDDRGPEVCLAAGFRPRVNQMELTLSTGGKEQVNTSHAPLNTKDSKYYFPKVSKEKIQSCKFSDVSVNRSGHQPDTKMMTATPTALPTTRGILAVARFSSESVQADQTKQNFSLLVFNGIRIVFTKALVFSSILTYRVLLF